uniref:Uncharacterized protein n=1 Tax=Arundo donax TaxID=35708 RepID=A0A0A9AHD0_ARUDO
MKLLREINLSSIRQ